MTPLEDLTEALYRHFTTVYPDTDWEYAIEALAWLRENGWLRDEQVGELHTGAAGGEVREATGTGAHPGGQEEETGGEPPLAGGES